jgi:hypothetical protein
MLRFIEGGQDRFRRRPAAMKKVHQTETRGRRTPDRSPVLVQLQYDRGPAVAGGGGPSAEMRERKTNMTDKAKTPASDVFDQALKNYEQALRTGVKLQEDAGKWWSRMVSQASSPQDLQKQINALANDAIPATQKTLEGYLDLLEQNSRASVDLLKKGMETVQSTSLADSQNKVVEFCEGTLKSLKASAQTVVDVNSAAMDSWMGLVKKAAQQAEPVVEKP